MCIRDSAEGGGVEKFDAGVAHEHSSDCLRAVSNKQVRAATDDEQRRACGVETRDRRSEVLGGVAADHISGGAADAQSCH